MVDEAKLESIFGVVLPLSEEQRRAYLDEACGDDSALRERVEGLLRASDAAGSFFDKPPAEFIPTIATGDLDTVDKAGGEISLEFLQPSEKPGCVGILGPYHVIEVVGRGGMGLVLRAHDTKLERIVAIKVMAPELAANPMAVKRFLREARAAAAVSHDHVVTIHAIEENNRPPFIVMEFVDGQSLQEKVDNSGGMALDEILRIGMQMARGLAAAHEQGLVHRDIKPANILLENGVERVKLTDFGLARAVDDVSVTQTGQIAGTPQFMSPEQAQGHAIDARSDLFSLGSVIYTMCTGRPPFQADSAVAMLRRVTDDDPRPIQEINSETPDWLEAITFKLLAKEPAERFQSAAEVAELLSQHLAHLQHPTTAPKPHPVIPSSTPVGGASKRVPHAAQDGFGKPFYRRRWLGIAGAALALLFAGIIYVVTDNGTLVIESDDENVEIAVRPLLHESHEGDKHSLSWQYGVGDTVTGSTVKRLGSGAYLVDLQGRENEFELSQDRFILKRGGKVIVKVTRRSGDTALPHKPPHNWVNVVRSAEPVRVIPHG
ncbi:MAG: serine/threonine protein kinase, partial [Planctomycetes bacterium]|nr:serine/threonine protein kinase [Planctomycetota bacterium]